MTTTNELEQKPCSGLSDLTVGLAVMFGTRWAVTRKEVDYCSCKEIVAVCRTQELAFAVMRNRPDYGKYRIEYDCAEVDNYE